MMWRNTCIRCIGYNCVKCTLCFGGERWGLSDGQGMTQQFETKTGADWNRMYQQKLWTLLTQIAENNALSSRDRVTLLDAHVDLVKASLREARTFVRAEERVVSVALEGQAKKVMRRLLANGKDPRVMSDDDLLKIGNVGNKTLEAIRQVIAKEG